MSVAELAYEPIDRFFCFGIILRRGDSRLGGLADRCQVVCIGKEISRSRRTGSERTSVIRASHAIVSRAEDHPYLQSTGTMRHYGVWKRSRLHELT